MNDDVQVPDGITPIRAWRLWELDGDGNLRSPQQRVRWQIGWQRAHCRVQSVHTTPNEYCRCGFYGLAEPHEAVERGWNSLAVHHPVLRHRLVLGTVEFAGDVLEHPKGWRAERARVASLVADNADPGLDCDIRQACDTYAAEYHVPWMSTTQRLEDVGDAASARIVAGGPVWEPNFADAALLLARARLIEYRREYQRQGEGRWTSVELLSGSASSNPLRTTGISYTTMGSMIMYHTSTDVDRMLNSILRYGVS